MISEKLRRIIRNALKNTRDLREDTLATRAKVATRIAQCNENGKIALVHGGRDCDMVEFHNLVRIIPATVVEYEREINDLHEQAEGPVWYYIAKPSEAKALQYHSRDLAMEAFEDGHPYVIYA